MSRSYKKTPVTGLTGCWSEKDWKTEWHRRWRARIKDAVREERDPPLLHEVCDIWDGPKDGKIWWPKRSSWSNFKNIVRNGRVGK